MRSRSVPSRLATVEIGLGRLPGWRRLQNPAREVLGADHAALRPHDEQMLDLVLQLAHISRPADNS